MRVLQPFSAEKIFFLLHVHYKGIILATNVTLVPILGFKLTTST